MTEIASIDWFGRWGTSVFSENTAVFDSAFVMLVAHIFLCRAPLHINELVNCRWAEEVTQQLDLLQHTVPPKDSTDGDKYVL